MKVDDAHTPKTETTKTSDGKRPSSTSGSFSEVLGRKLGGTERKKASQDQLFPLSNENSLVLPTIIPADQTQSGIVSQPAAETRSEAINIQGLVQEILVVAQPNGQHSVELQFNSKSLDGLHVKISQEQDQIAIRFSTASASVSELISRNLDQLSDALHRKGLELAPIQVELTPAPTNSVANNTGSRDGRRGQQNEEQRQQQQRKR
jgi:flagellar hook-length control protein FliK